MHNLVGTIIAVDLELDETVLIIGLKLEALLLVVRSKEVVLHLIRMRLCRLERGLVEKGRRGFFALCAT